ncbi:hypothetical protein M2341_002154 [Sphingobium sp. B7D2B]|uniref:hypothetical protein n=1 Tax=Sphingobium sp. B7D2B TaxID=2940583 RepID=UPI002224C239|nr:hypothetical protein [Sphingobium sp. B7D2B]MCW2366707.1 hypothetical protein [Sphingobium sp. B7D2B]
MRAKASPQAPADLRILRGDERQAKGDRLAAFEACETAAGLKSPDLKVDQLDLNGVRAARPRYMGLEGDGIA